MLLFHGSSFPEALMLNSIPVEYALALHTHVPCISRSILVLFFQRKETKLNNRLTKKKFPPFSLSDEVTFFLFPHFLWEMKSHRAHEYFAASNPHHECGAAFNPHSYILTHTTPHTSRAQGGTTIQHSSAFLFSAIRAQLWNVETWRLLVDIIYIIYKELNKYKVKAQTACICTKV